MGVQFDSIAVLYRKVVPVVRDNKKHAQHIINETGIQSGDHLLDVGGGTGDIAEHFVPQHKVTIVDPSMGMLQQVQSHHVRTVQGTASKLPFPNDAFHVSYTVDALHHFTDDSFEKKEPDEIVFTAIGEMLRVTKPGGHVVLVEFDPSRMIGKGIVLLERLAGWDSTFYIPARLQGLADDYGYRSVVKYINSYTYSLTIRL